MSAAEANDRSTNDASINNRLADAQPSSHQHSHSFISNLKRFNIDPSSKYKHYGHQSLLNARAVESIMAGEPPSPSNNHEPTPSADLAKVVIDETLSQILGIPPQILAADSVWPYTSDTLNEVLRYKIEQERTRQETIKHEHAATAIELLKLARSLNMSGEALSYLFTENNSVEALLAKLEKLRRHREAEGLGEPLAELPHKRRNSDSRAHHHQLPSFTETTESIKPHTSRPGSMLPTRSPSRLPPMNHRRIRSDGSEHAEVKDHELSASSHTPHSIGAHQGANHLHQNLPGLVEQTPKHTRSPQAGQAPHQTPQLAPVQPHRSSPPAYPGYYQPESKGNNRNLGSPYNLKYPAIVYSGPYNSQYLPPQQHYQYYVGPPPPGTTAAGPPPGHYLVPSMPGQVISSYAPLPEEHGRRDDTEDASPLHGTKRHRSNNSAKTSSINFMITTPKNPPAKKYNNSKGNN